MVMKSARTIISALVLAGVAIGILGANASDRFITNTLTQQWEPIFTGTGNLAPSKNLLRFTTSGGVDVIPDPLFGASTCTCYISDFRLPRVTWTVSVDAKQAIASSALPPDSEFLTYIRSVQQDFLFPFEVRYDFCMYVKVTPAGSSIGYSAFEVTTSLFGGDPVRREITSDEVALPRSSKNFSGKLVYSYNPTNDLLTMQFGRNTLTIPGYVNTFLPSKEVFFWQPVVGIGCSANYVSADPPVTIQPFTFGKFRASNLTLPGSRPEPRP